MSPRKPTIEGPADVDDQDGVLEEETPAPTDLDLTIRDEQGAGLGGLPNDLEEDEEE